jgi:hypothetical protein
MYSVVGRGKAYTTYLTGHEVKVIKLTSSVWRAQVNWYQKIFFRKFVQKARLPIPDDWTMEQKRPYGVGPSSAKHRSCLTTCCCRPISDDVPTKVAVQDSSMTNNK